MQVVLKLRFRRESHDNFQALLKYLQPDGSVLSWKRPCYGMQIEWRILCEIGVSALMNVLGPTQVTKIEIRYVYIHWIDSISLILWIADLYILQGLKRNYTFTCDSTGWANSMLLFI